MSDAPSAILITDPDDPRIAPYRAVRERDVVGRGERLVAEGEVVLRLLLSGRCRHTAESLLVSEKRLERLGDLLDPLPPDVPLYVAGQSVMDAVVGFHIHRGVLAIGRRAPDEGAAALLAGLPERALVVALSGVSNHDNVGGIFRNAAAFGAEAVLLDGACCDPLYRKAIRVSVGASLITPFSRGGAGEDMLDALEAAGFETVALSPSGDVQLHELARAPRTALLLGAEGPGLPPALMARARTARIDMAAGFDSLNVAATSAVALYAMTRL
ncbi:RNA methyltransferase [Chelatococcus sambhunathii]|uniref:RNA methyltransferase n=1 Tax=Chelatococcus sambhunathii TaxID=363953 RepID=A0ABU1DE48_9HYPH|nr:RNA methyltransferase [Chelatococcus sambhunathii]MDR4306319.1 RNA methyltransferase [Chelatococcus sambhunathii]